MPDLSYASITGSPYATPGQLTTTGPAGFANRNIALLTALRQLQGPSLENLYEQPGADTLGKGYKASKQSILAPSAARGLLDTGAVPTAQRGARMSYAGGLGQNFQAGAVAETARKQALLAFLKSVIAGDISTQGGLSSALLTASGGAASQDLLGLQNMVDLGQGVGNIAAIVAGGYAGGAGGGGLSGAASGAVGAYEGTQQFQSGGGGGGGGLRPFGQQPDQTGLNYNGLDQNSMNSNADRAYFATQDPSFRQYLSLGGTY